MSQKEEEPSLCRFPDPVPPLAINFCPVNLSHARSSLLGQSVIIYPRRAVLTTKTPGSLNLFLCVPDSWWLNFCATLLLDEETKMKNGKLRSQNWFTRKGREGFVHRAWLKAEGFTDAVFENRPVIGIANSWSELNNCNSHLREVAEAVKRGVLMAGGLPLEFPVISLGEVLMKPTAMMFRNLMSMDVEECIRANPLDGVVLLCGCDKTTPAMIMGAASADVPAVVVTGGPMLRGMWRDQELGSGTDVWKYWDLLRAGRISDEEWCEIESCISRSHGHCMVMGTASTMTSMVEALGLTLPGCAAIPAADSRRMAVAEASGRRIVEMVYEDLRPSRILTREAFENAIRVDMAIGGSTNAIIHLVAMAGRARLGLPLSLFDGFSRETP